jgi:hypothetical protein
MMFFRKLSPGEDDCFRRAARQDYGPFTSISGLWHPVYQDECVRINNEKAEFVEEEDT